MAESSANSYGSTIDLLNELAEFLGDYADVRDGAYGEQVPNQAMHLQSVVEREIERLKRSSGPNDEAVKLLRRCHDAGDLVTPLDETLREDVAAFFGGKDG
jgi:hypothetical protein